MKKILLALTLFVGVVTYSFGQTISLTSTAYTQNFNTLSLTAASTTNILAIPGWSITETGGGARDNEQYGVDDGTSTTGDIYSYGTTASTDRALGSLRSGTLIGSYGAFFTNDSAVPITSILISYTGEQWRLGTISRTDKLSFSYSLDATSLTTGTFTAVPALDFITPNIVTIGSKDGNLPANRVAISTTITGLNIPVGATIFIKWDDTDASGADDGLAIDDFSLLINPNPLAVSLLSPTARTNGKNIDLTWKTTFEINNAHFDILRSSDGQLFNKIGEIKGAGSTQTEQSYLFSDINPLPGTNYYKLQQIDLSGAIGTESTIIAVKSNVTASNFKILSNRDNNTIDLTIFAATEGKGSLMIYDLSGKKLVETQLDLQKGYKTFSIPVQVAAQGLHIATLTIGAETITNKFIQ